jgi:GTP-binding protein EngB required for normal cell division
VRLIAEGPLSESESKLNENHQRHLRVTCEYIDKLFSEIEEILNSAVSKAAFPKYISEITPARRRMVEDYIARVRGQLVRVLDGQGIIRSEPTTADAHAIYIYLHSIGIAIDDLRPKNMRGYGEVSAELATELNGIVGEMDGLISRLASQVMQREGEDLAARLARLEGTTNERELLKSIERVVNETGLVEFRSSIAAILDRMEDKTFEIAVFGRVSSGKSSLLNGILGMDILPVGVTPITAVPTRIRFGPKAELDVRFAERQPIVTEIGCLPEFATEQQNPGNSKHVSRLFVELPAKRLKDGVVFVDTPGLGSLATSGAAETLAYMPRCDLGVVLVDSGATLTPDDVRTIASLQEAAIPVHLLLSKADLLATEDRERVLAYVTENVAKQCGLTLPVHPVSAMGSHRELLDRWFDEQILPLYGKSQELKAASIRRKVGALRDALVATLRMQARRDSGQEAVNPAELHEIEAKLRQATGRIQEVRPKAEQEIEKLLFLRPEILRQAAAEIAASNADSSSQSAVEQVAHEVQNRTKVFHEYVASLALRSAQELIEAGTALNLPNVPDENEFDALLRDVPVFELDGVVVNVSRPAVGGLLGKGFVASRIAAQLTEQMGEKLDDTLATYAELLRSWVATTLRRLKASFDVYADSYRAQIERVLAGQQKAEGASDITRCLKLLGAIDEPARVGVEAQTG